MITFHICFLVCTELCTGINIKASNYIDAMKQFTKQHGEKEILYVTKLVGQ